MFPHFSSHSDHVPQSPVVKHWPFAFGFDGSGLGGSGSVFDGSGSCFDTSGAAIGTGVMNGANINVDVGHENEV